MSVRPSFVYFVQAGPEGPIRIGLSIKPHDRVVELQKFCPAVLAVLAIVPATFREEWLLQWLFREHQLHHDWFAPAPEILACAAFAGVLGRIPVSIRPGFNLPPRPKAHCKPRRKPTPEQRAEFAQAMARHAANRRAAKALARAEIAGRA